MSLIVGRERQDRTDKRLDGDLVEEIQSFQKKAGIKADGVVGPHTLILMNSYVDDSRPVLYQVRR